MPLCLLVWLVFAQGASAEPPAETTLAVEDPTATIPVRVSGNLVLIDEVYEALVGRLAKNDPSLAEPTQKSAEWIAQAVQAFLVDAGYTLAQVHGRQGDDGVVELVINEGRLARIIFRGQGTVETLQLQLQLSIPHDVYNARLIQRQLDALSAEYGFGQTTFELVPIASFEHVGEQLVNVGRVDGSEAPPPPTAYQLHVLLEKTDWETGLSMEVGYDSSDGVLLGGAYAGEGGLWADDRWRLGAQVGATSFGSLVGKKPDIRLSRVGLDGVWYMPPLFGIALRPHVTVDAKLHVRQRRDLALQRYNWLRVASLASLAYRLNDYFAFDVGGGGEYRQAFDIEQVELDPPLPPVEGFVDARALARLRLELTFDPEELRVDRHHTVALEGRRYFPDTLWEATLRHQKVFGLGWHDLWLRLSGAGAWGDVTFVDEVALSEHLRSLFIHQYWVEWVGTVSMAFRYSLRRDVLKVGSFLDVAVFQDPGRGRRARGVKAGFATGLGIHTLALEVVQLDLVYALGVTTDGVFDQAVNLSLQKAF